MKIAITGKGGVGKTTISSMLARALAESGKNVLAIDADPNGNLPEAIGYDSLRNGKLTPLIEEKELIKQRTGAAPGESFGGVFALTPKVNDLVDRLAKEANGVRVMITGELREALTGCYCPENSILRAFIRHLIVERDEWVILDMEAGFEHLTRGTAESVDMMLVVVEPGRRSIQTAAKITKLAGQIGIRRYSYIVNKLHDEEELKTVASLLEDEDVWASVFFSNDLVKADLFGKAPFDQCQDLHELVYGLVGKLENLKPQV